MSRTCGWCRPTAGTPRQLTSGTVRDMEPRISPDGTRVAFTRCTPAIDRKAVVVLDVRGGELITPATGELSARDVAWSPDGRQIAFRARTDPQRFIVGPVPGPTADATEPRARRVTVLDYRWDETGYIDRRRQLFVVDAVEGAVPRALTSLACGVDAFAWRPDGGAIAIVADPREDADLHPRTSIWEVLVTAGAGGAAEVDNADVRPGPREILALAGPVSRPAYSPDGRWLAVVGVDDPDFFDDLSPTLFVGPSDGSGPARRPRPGPRSAGRKLGRHRPDGLAGRAVARPGVGRARRRRRPRHGPRPDASLAVPRRPAHRAPRRGPGEAGARRRHGPYPRRRRRPRHGHRHGRRAPAGAVRGRPVGELRPLTTTGSSWIDGLAWPHMRCVDAPGPGGPIETWIASPAGASDSEALPTVVDVHGGPFGAWSPAPSLEVVLLCARGYRVVLPNIRGSCSYGAEWITPQLGDWGGPDAEDVHAALDHVVRARPGGP